MIEFEFFRCSQCEEVVNRFLEDIKNDVDIQDNEYKTTCNHTIHVVCKEDKSEWYAITPNGLAYTYSSKEYQEDDSIIPLNRSMKMLEDALKERDRARKGVADLNNGIDQMLINAGQKAIDAERRERATIAKYSHYEKSLLFKLWSFFRIS